ncbi:MarR family winged helix-turn-helix transcriptional regulator [Pararobbsia silviterrae]|uniref:MarR family transcriptional regulator n=1 Tax=Pararobbsia silviterrae TaxID=1792498 RepID=A0A494X6V0_9BURK|nr:MarR family transcriptional regulator [Pararobbsia silviterrae]RKP43924.1 MarR family transcriptional regulator [Pararobbsia silviterrae]
MRERDYVDAAVAEWNTQKTQRPFDDVALLMRVIRIGGILERELAALCTRFNLKAGQFQALSALRRAYPRTLTPSELNHGTLLTSGAMTPLIDRLEEKGLVKRLADPDDRRGVRVELTRAGCALIDEALDERIARLAELVAPLGDAELVKSESALRKILLLLEGPTENTTS